MPGLKNDRLTALMAAIPSRRDILRQSVASILPQVGELRIILNGFHSIPTWLNLEPKVVAILSEEDRLTSNAVWTLMDGLEGYVLIADDDLLYPPNYGAAMMRQLDEFDGEAVACVLGTNFKQPFADYLRDRQLIYFEEGNSLVRMVDLGGVGTCAFHTRSFRPRLEDFPERNSRDLWFALKAAKEDLPIICVRRPAKWLRQLQFTGPCVWNSLKEDYELLKLSNAVISNELLPLLAEPLPRHSRRYMAKERIMSGDAK